MSFFNFTLFFSVFLFSCTQGNEKSSVKENEEDRLRKENEIKLKLKEEIAQKVTICSSCCVIFCTADILNQRDCNLDNFEFRQLKIYSHKPIIKDSTNFSKNILTFTLFENKLYSLIHQKSKNYQEIISVYNDTVVNMLSSGQDIRSYYNRGRVNSSGSLTLTGNPAIDRKNQKESERKDKEYQNMIGASETIARLCESKCKTTHDPD